MRDVFGADIAVLRLGDIRHASLLIPVQIDRDFIAVMLSRVLRHAVQQEHGVVAPAEVIGFEDFPVAIKWLSCPA